MLQTRVSARALKSAAVLASAIGTGSAVGVALAVAYLAGGMAQAASDHARVTRLAAAAQEGFSEATLLTAALNMDPGALVIARRHDPFTVAGDAQRDRQAALVAARLERHVRQRQGAESLLVRASYGGPAAAPFQLGGALDASRDLECLTQAIYYEARGEGPAGQAAVAQVVLNRVRHPAFPKSVCGVVYQGAAQARVCQFSFACDGSMRRRREPGAWRRAERVAEKALSGAVMGTVGNATHFHTIHVSPAWGAQLMRVGQVGLHVFYRFGGRSGRPSAFSAQPEMSLDTPEMAVEPIYARYDPQADAGPGERLDDQQAVRLTSAVLEIKPEALAVVPGMGGPVGEPAPPASAPAKAKASKPVAARPAASTEAAAQPAAPKAPAPKPPAETTAAADAPIRTSAPVRTSEGPTSASVS